MHSQLEHLVLPRMNIGGLNGCTALATLLRCTTSELETLDLSDNVIDDEGIEVLVDALANGSTNLQRLILDDNRSITTRGWKAVATLLKNPHCNIETLSIGNSNIGDDGVQVFVNALANKSTLKTLHVIRNNITVVGWAPFLILLCDTSTVNKTYSSNHTLESLTLLESLTQYNILPELSDHVRSYLELNKNENKGEVAMFKMIRHHSRFNMQPFFEWEFKVLPLVITWFAKADTRIFERNGRLIPGMRGHPQTLRMKISRMKLSSVYDFIKEFPMLYIEPVTRKEIVEYTALEDDLQGDELEEMLRCKDRAMKRLS